MEYSDLPTVYRYIIAQRAICTGTESQKQNLRAYFLSRPADDSTFLSRQWNAVAQEICKLIAGVPWMLEVFLDCGYGRPYITTMFMQVLKHDNSSAFLNIIRYEPLASRFAARRSDELFYNYVWTHYVPVMRKAILDTYLRLDGFVLDTDAFLSIIPSLAPSQLETIMNHPFHRDFVYKLTSPYTYVENQVRQKYTYAACMQEPLIIQNYGIYQYINAERVWTHIKRARRQRIWRFLFWCAVLHSRMMEHRENYWALHGKRVRTAAAEFYELSKGGSPP